MPIKCRIWTQLPINCSSHLWTLIFFQMSGRTFLLLEYSNCTRKKLMYLPISEDSICIYPTFCTLQESGLCASLTFLLVTCALKADKARTKISESWNLQGMRWWHMPELRTINSQLVNENQSVHHSSHLQLFFVLSYLSACWKLYQMIWGDIKKRRKGDL